MCAMLQSLDQELPERQKKLAQARTEVVARTPVNVPKIKQPESSSRATQVLTKARRQAEAGRYQEAINLLNGLGPTEQAAINDKAVCLMRMGRAPEAVQVLRNLVLQPGSTWMRRKLPLAYKVNFATALGLAGLVSGCTEILHEINQPTSPQVMRLEVGLRKWRQGLSFWRKFSMLMGVESPRGITLDYVPGEFSELANAS